MAFHDRRCLVSMTQESEITACRSFEEPLDLPVLTSLFHEIVLYVDILNLTIKTNVTKYF